MADLPKIDVGFFPNDLSGDDIRKSFQKTNAVVDRVNQLDPKVAALEVGAVVSGEAIEAVDQKAQLAFDTATSAAAGNGVICNTLDELEENTTALIGQVIADPVGTNNGTYARTTPDNPATPWIQVSTATVTALDARLSPMEIVVDGAKVPVVSGGIVAEGGPLLDIVNKFGFVLASLLQRGFDGQAVRWNFGIGDDGTIWITDPNGFSPFYITAGGDVQVAFRLALERRLDVVEASLLPPTPPDVTPLYGHELFVVSGEIIPLQVRSMLKGRRDAATALVTFSTRPDQPLAGWWRTSGEQILIDADMLLATTAQITVRRFDTIPFYQVPLAVSRKVVPVSGSPAPKVLLLADSIGNRALGKFVADRLTAWGFNPTFVGTFKGTASGDNLAETGPFGECREGWAFDDFTGRSMDADVASILAAGSEAAYAAMTKDQKRQINPYLRLATGGDDPARIVTIGGIPYVFDFGFFISRFAGVADPKIHVENPTVIYIQLGMNDILESTSTAELLTRVEYGLAVMLDSIRATLPTVPIGVGFTGVPRVTLDDARWSDLHMPLTQALIRIVEARQASDANLHLVSVWAHMSQDVGYLTSGTMNGDTGAITATVADPTHPSGENRDQMAQRVAAFIANVV
ncbi:SGNH/GDSL hydrolase family protein [Chelatococcus reniformis]|nr:SGNH/GDSL hydrolase family protein [Chelatococcus reniformis]